MNIIDIKIVKRYTESLIMSKKEASIFLDDYKLFISLINSTPLMYIIKEPLFTKNAKMKVVQSIFRNKRYIFSYIFKNFLYVLINNKRLNFISLIFEYFSNNYNKLSENVDIVTNKYSHIKCIKNLLLDRQVMRSKNITITFKINKLILGGFYINYSNYMIDSTVKTQIKNMKTFINNININN